MTVNMRIGTRILAGYGLALLVVGGVGIVAYRVSPSSWTAPIGSPTLTT